MILPPANASGSIMASRSVLGKSRLRSVWLTHDRVAWVARFERHAVGHALVIERIQFAALYVNTTHPGEPETFVESWRWFDVHLLLRPTGRKGWGRSHGNRKGCRKEVTHVLLIPR